MEHIKALIAELEADIKKYEALAVSDVKEHYEEAVAKLKELVAKLKSYL